MNKLQLTLLKTKAFFLAALLLFTTIFFSVGTMPAFAKAKAPKAPKLKFVDWASYSKISIRFTRVKGADGYIIYRSSPVTVRETVQDIPAADSDVTVNDQSEETVTEPIAATNNPDNTATASSKNSSNTTPASSKTPSDTTPSASSKKPSDTTPSVNRSAAAGQENTDADETTGSADGQTAQTAAGQSDSVTNQTENITGDTTAPVPTIDPKTLKYKRIKVNKGNKNLRAIVSANRDKICYYQVRAYKKTKKGKKLIGKPSNVIANVSYKDSPLGELFPKGPPKTKKAMKKYLTYVKVPIYSHGKKKYIRLRVHKKLKKKIKKCFKEMYKIKFPVKASDTGSYKWRKMRTVRLRSHHSYGCVVDLNWDDNPMCSLSEIGHSEYKPGKNRYSIRKKVVKIWKKQGFYWGGDWTEKKDYMHLTYTNN